MRIERRLRVVRRLIAGITLLIALAGLAALTGCSSARAAPEPTARVVFSTGSPAGVYYAWGSALADRLSLRGLALTVTTSSGSRENIRRVQAGEATMALASEDTTVGVSGLTALARVYDDYLQVIVRAGSPVDEVAGLAGRPVAVGSAGSGTALVADRLLTDAAIKVQRRPLDLDAALTALDQGTVDAVFWSGGIPTVAVTRFAAVTPIRLLPLGNFASQLQADYDGVYRPATIPAGTYGLAEPVAGMATANLLLTRPDAPAGAVSTVLTTMFGDRAELAVRVPAARALDVRTAIFTGSLPLHPAATDYYRRVKR